MPRHSLALMAVVVLALAVLACGSQSRPTPTSVPSPAPPSPTPAPTPNLSESLWSLTRGGAKADQAWGVDVDSTGNVYLGAYEQAPGDLFTDMAVYKFTPDGVELWQARWGGHWMEKAFVVAVAEPMVYVGGLTQTGVGLETANMAVLALNADDGKLAWEFTWDQGFGYEEVDGLVVEGDSIYVSGWTTGEKTSNDAAILKLDEQGNLVWAKTWGTEGWDQADGQMVVDDEAIYIVGRYNAPNALLGGEAYIAKFSKETGDLVAYKTWGGAVLDDALGLASDGEALYAVGLTLSRGNGGQIFLLKYDKDLNLLWEQTWGGPRGESARALAVNGAGQILVAGQTDSYGQGANDIVLLQYSPEGALLWSQTWGGPEIDTALGLVIDNEFAYVAGLTFSFGAGQQDALLIKADSSSGQLPQPGQ